MRTVREPNPHRKLKHVTRSLGWAGHAPRARQVSFQNYQKMALHCLEHGRVGADVRLGALELLGDDEVIGRAPDSFKWEDDDIVHPDVTSALVGTRAVLVNPPFSDNTMRNRNVDAETKQAMQEREKRVRERVAASDPAAGELIDINSISTFFTPLIDSVLREKTGVLAKSFR